jgi:nucleobase:cation symporter-1, NCS1 family
MLRCIFTGWEKIPNDIPPSQYTTTQGLVGFFLAFCVTMPFMFVHTVKIRHLFTVKAVVMPVCALGIVIWATKNNGGVSAGVVEDGSVRGGQTAFAFGVISQFNAGE